MDRNHDFVTYNVVNIRGVNNFVLDSNNMAPRYLFGTRIFHGLTLPRVAESGLSYYTYIRCPALVMLSSMQPCPCFWPHLDTPTPLASAVGLIAMTQCQCVIIMQTMCLLQVCRRLLNDLTQCLRESLSHYLVTQVSCNHRTLPHISA